MMTCVTVARVKRIRIPRPAGRAADRRHDDAGRSGPARADRPATVVIIGKTTRNQGKIVLFVGRT